MREPTIVAAATNWSTHEPTESTDVAAEIAVPTGRAVNGAASVCT